MPEVSEVALTAEILDKKLKGKKLISLEFVSGRYTKKDPVGYVQFTKALPLPIGSINSKGKFLWFDLGKWYIWNTFGLDGKWSFKEPDYLRAKLEFQDGLIVYYSDKLSYGTFKFSNDENELDDKLNKLGPDFLKDDDFDISQVKKYNLPIVKILMDQKKVGSGIGNYLVAEILYRAKISPHIIGKKFTDDMLETLEYWIKYTTKLAYENNKTGYMINLIKEAKNVKKKDYHTNIKLKKKEFEFLVYGQKQDPYGNAVKKETIIKGRTTWWVPAIQK